MKAIKYTRVEHTFHIHNTVHIDIIYIDELDVCLYKQLLGSFSSADYGIITNQTLTIEAKEIFHDNEIPICPMNEVEFKNIVRFEIDDDIIRGLVSKAKLYDILKDDVKKGIDNLID